MRKTIFIIFLLGLLFVLLMSIQAQDGYLCQMRADDCMILESSWDATSDLHSLTFQTLLKVDVESKGRASDTLSMEILGGGQFDLTDYVSDSGPQGDDESDAAYQRRSTEDMANFVEALTMQSSFVVTVPGSGFLSSPQSINIDFIIADGIFYMDGAPFVNQGGTSSEPMWVSIDLAGYLREYYQPVTNSNAVDFTAEENNQFLREIVTINRTTDTSINGRQSATFEYNFDLSSIATFFDSEIAVAAFNQSAGQQGMSIFEAKLMIEMIKQVLLQAEMDAHLYIGLDDYFPQRLDFSFDADLSKLGMKDLDFIIRLDFSLDMSNFNEPVNVKIPANAMTLPLSMIAAQMGS